LYRSRRRRRQSKQLLFVGDGQGRRRINAAGLIDGKAVAREVDHLLVAIDLEDGLIDSNIERTRPMGPYRTSSMIDFVEGREVEVAPIWEEPLRRAKEAGVAMPHTENLLLRIRERLASRG
jgi:ketopantoate reductase